MSFTMRVDASVTGQQSIDGLNASAGKFTATTLGVNEALYGQATALGQLTILQAKLAIEQAKTAGYTVQYNIALLENSRAANVAAESQDRLASATQRTVGSTLAAGTALRVMEGAMPIRAAASFLGSIQGINTAMQFAFPLFGAVALFEVAARIGGELGSHLGLWGEISKAEQEATSNLQKYSQEARASLIALRALQQDRLTHDQGPAAGAAAKIAGQRGDAGAAGLQTGTLQKQVAALQNYLRQTKDSNVVLSDEDVALLDALNQDPKKGTYTGAYPNLPFGRSTFRDLNPFTDTSLPSQRKAAQDALRVVTGELDKSSIGTQVMQSQASNAANALTPSVAEQGEQDKAAREKAAQEAKEAGKEADRKAKEAARKKQQDQTHAIEIGNRSYNALLDSLGGGDPLTKQLHEARQKTFLEARADPDNATQIQSEGRSREGQIVTDNNRKLAEGRERAQELLAEPPEVRAAKDPNAAEEKNGFMQQNPALFRTASLTGLISPEDQLKQAHTYASSTLKLATDADRGKGVSPEKRADDEYAARLKGIQAVADAEERLARKETDNAKAAEIQLDAKKTKEDAIYDAQMQREDALQAIIEQHAEAARTLAGGLFDAIHSHSTNQWTRAFGVGQEKALFENLASPIIHSASSMLGSAIPGQTNADGTESAVGKLLHGTVLSSANMDPAHAAVNTATNTKQTVAELQGLRTDMKVIATGKPEAGSAIPGSSSAGGLAGAIPGGGGSSANGDLNDPVMFAQAMKELNAPNSGLGAPNAFAPVGSSSTTSAMLSTLGQFSKGITAGPNAAINTLFNNTPAGTVGWASDAYTGANGLPVKAGQATDQYGNGITTSTAQTAGMVAGLAASVATGTMAAVSEFSKGGAAGALGGISAIAGMASMIPGAAIIAAPIAAVTGLLSSVLSTGPAQRALQITDEINKGAYLAPTALNVNQSMNGTYQSFDARGNLRTSTMAAVPTVAQPYITTRELNGSQSWYDVPGSVTQPYQGGAQGTPQNPVTGAGSPAQTGAKTPIIIQAMDAKSFVDFADQNSDAIGNAAATHLEHHEGRLSNAIRYAAGS
jgi:hypothetical protein